MLVDTITNAVNHRNGVPQCPFTAFIAECVTFDVCLLKSCHSELQRFSFVTRISLFCCACQLLAKVSRLQARITLVVFNYVRRGLVEKDKLIVASLVALKTMRLCGENSGGRSAIESFLSPQPAGDSSVFPEEARRSANFTPATAGMASSPTKLPTQLHLFYSY